MDTMRDARTPSTEMKHHCMGRRPYQPALIAQKSLHDLDSRLPMKTKYTSETACLQMFFLPSQQPEICSLTIAKRVKVGFSTPSLLGSAARQALCVTVDGNHQFVSQRMVVAHYIRRGDVRDRFLFAVRAALLVCTLLVRTSSWYLHS